MLFAPGLMTVGWLSEGSNALVPTWHYYRWDPETRQQVKDDRAPLAQDQVMHQVETLMRVGTSPTNNPAAVQDAPQAGSGNPSGGGCTLQDLCESERTGSAEHVRGSDSTLKLLGLRLRPERMQKTALATELENAYLNTSFADWTRRNPQWGRSSGQLGISDAQALASASEALSAAFHFLHSPTTPPGSP